MATDVTVLTAYVNDDYFGDPSAGYPFSGTGSGGTTMVWIGTTTNAVGTYGSPTSIVAEEELTFDAGHLFVGPLIATYGSVPYSFTIGSDTLGEYGEIELVSNRDSVGEILGRISWRNEDSAHAEKLSVSVWADRALTGGAAFRLDVASLSDVMENVYLGSPSQQSWYMNNAESVRLTDGVLDGREVTSLGGATSKWVTGWFFDAYVGELTQKYGDADYTLTIGSDEAVEHGQVEFISQTTSNTKLGGVSWHNVEATPADGKVAELYATRNDDNDTAYVRLDIATPAGTGMDYSYRADWEGHFWWAEAGLEMGLSTAALYPYSDGGLTLGDGSYRWNYLYTNNIRDYALAGTGTRLVVATSTGILNASVEDTSANWNTAYTHSQVTTGNPHSVEWTELDGARTTITLSGFNDDLTYNNYSHPNHTGHVTSSGDGAQTLVVAAITGQSEITSGLDSDDEFVIQYDGSIRRMDVSVLQTYMQNNLSFGAGYWTDNDGSLSPNDAGDDILLDVTTGRLAWGDNDTYIYESVDDTLNMYCGGNPRLTLQHTGGLTIYTGMYPSATDSWDLGSNSLFYKYIYGQRFCVDVSTAYINYSGTELQFTDGVSGTVSLSTLAAGSVNTQFGTYENYNSASQWIPVAHTDGGDHGMAIISLFGYDSGNHAAAKFIVSFHHGEGSITQIAGDTYSGMEFEQVALFYNDADRVYNGGRFAVWMAPGVIVRVVIEDYNYSYTYNEWELYVSSSSGDIEDMTGWTLFQKLEDVEKTPLATTGNALIGGNVGIGTVTPAAPLHVRQDSTSNLSILKLQNSSSWSTPMMSSISVIDGTNAAVGAIGWRYTASSTTVDMHIHSLYNGGYEDESDIIATFKGNGNVGIGTTSPDAILHAHGNMNAQYGIKLSSSTVGITAFLGMGYADATADYCYIDGDNNGTPVNIAINRNGGNVGIGTTTPTAQLDIYSSASTITRFGRSGANDFTFEISSDIFGLYDNTADKYIWRTDNGNLELLPASGRVGIGVISTYAVLEVDGGVNAGIGIHRSSGKPSIEAMTDGYMMIESKGSGQNCALNWYTDDDVILAYGGGSVGVGTDQTPSYKLDVTGNFRVTTTSILMGDVSIGATTACTAGYRVELFSTDNKGRAADWTATSDIHLKTNVVKYGPVLGSIMDLYNSEYGLSVYNRWVVDEKGNPTDKFYPELEVGFIAQDTMKPMPLLVHGSEKEFYDISYMRMAAVALTGVAELKDEKDMQIEKLERRLETLEQKLIDYGNNHN